jgi:hypothetical protein
MPPPVQQTPISWRPLGQARVTSTAPLIGGPRGPLSCPPPIQPNTRGLGWQHYSQTCGGLGAKKKLAV